MTNSSASSPVPTIEDADLTPTDRLNAIMACLRDPEDGCPWDIEQDFATIAPHTIEEAYEVADAIERGDMAGLKGELGDLLFQVVYHARMAEEAGHFTYTDVVEAISEKMIRRHPHVFGDKDIATADAQTIHWEELKAAERAADRAQDVGPESALDGVTAALPALTRAVKLQRRAARVGFDWTEARQILAKIREEVAEVEAELPGQDPDRLEDEVGDLLFAVANLARRLDVEPETALRHANLKFERRFRAMERALQEAGTPATKDLPLEVMEAAWQRVKRGETPG